jgi:hypothetical protein
LDLPFLLAAVLEMTYDLWIFAPFHWKIRFDGFKARRWFL